MDRLKIGKKLMELRGAKPKKEVANDLGISLSALSMYEQGKRIPRDEIKIKISEYYNTDIKEIFFESKCHETGQKVIDNWWKGGMIDG